MTNLTDRKVSSTCEDEKKIIHPKKVAFSPDKPRSATEQQRTTTLPDKSETIVEKSRKGGSKVCGMSLDAYNSLKDQTGLCDEDLTDRYQEFASNFPSGVMTYKEFRELSSQILEPSEVDSFCRNVFRMFDANKDAALTFAEFTIATSAKDTTTPADKLSWLFDHVYDKNKSGRISKSELHEILTTLLKMENVIDVNADELVNDIFRDLDLNQDGLINKREFIVATSQSTILNKILAKAGDQSQKKKYASLPDAGKSCQTNEPETEIVPDEKKKKKKRKTTKRKVNYDPTQRRPSREIETYGMGVKSLLIQSQEESSEKLKLNRRKQECL